MVSGIDAAAGRTLARAVGHLLKVAGNKRCKTRTRQDSRTVAPVKVADQLIDELSDSETAGLVRYLESPDFEEIAMQLTLGRLLQDKHWDDVRVAVREELRQGLRHATDLPPDRLLRTTDVVYDALLIAVTQLDFGNHPIDPATVAVAGHLAAAAARNGRLLAHAGRLNEFHEFAERMRANVAALQGEIRLAHLGVSRSVPYEQLYVEPPIRPELHDQEPPTIPELAVPGHRTVVLGSPGAGKSTLTTKIAYDIATDRYEAARGRVPFLVVLRNFVSAFQQGERGLAGYLEGACREPYNVEPPADAVEYLLRNGRAVVLLDGLDELVEPALRRRVVQLVEGFVHSYPLVPVLITARRVGYTDAPLDRYLFHIGVLEDFDTEQITAYAERWFALDQGTPAPDRERLAKAFLQESSTIPDLRSNPLLLALLCHLYSTEHYIPRNLTQVYERCAVMLFDRWDSMRGIKLPLQFQGRLRCAVQHLAWKQLTSKNPGVAQTRSKIVQVLADYLQTKRLDNDEAIATADQFMNFCTNRAWILTDVGSTEMEPRYGFTHRTFMEYFAAEHLVRTNPSPDALWGALRPRVLHGEWDVVSQIALQLFDRNVDDGADMILRLALAEQPGDFSHQSALATFVARSLAHVFPAPDVVRAVVDAVVGCITAPDAVKRFSYWPYVSLLKIGELLDGPISIAIQNSSPSNLPIILAMLEDSLRRLIDADNEHVMYAVHGPLRGIKVGEDRHAEIAEFNSRLRATHAERIAQWEKRLPRPLLRQSCDPARLREFFTQFDPPSLYLYEAFREGVSVYPPILELISETKNNNPRGSVLLCSNLLMETPTPWLPSGHWWADYNRTDRMEPLILLDTFESVSTGDNLAALMVIFLPYLETAVHENAIASKISPLHPLFAKLITAHKSPRDRENTLRVLAEKHLPKKAVKFLSSWVRNEISVIG